MINNTNTTNVQDLINVNNNLGAGKQVKGAGFYKAESKHLLYAPNFVLNKDFELRIESKDTYEYPVDGWFWCETEEEAYEKTR